MSGRMNYSGVSRGTALRQHVVAVRFEGGCKPGPKQDHKLHGRMTDVRRLLRTDKSIGDIAEELGVALQTLRGFIKRRSLCNMNERQTMSRNWPLGWTQFQAWHNKAERRRRLVFG